MVYDARDPDNGDVLWSDGDQLLLSFDSPTVRLGLGLGLGLGYPITLALTLTRTAGGLWAAAPS